MEQKAVPYDSYPRRLFTYCKRVDCFTKMLTSLMKLAEEENRILLYDTSHEKYHLDCPRSAGGTTPATCDRTWKWADEQGSRRVGTLLREQRGCLLLHKGR